MTKAKKTTSTSTRRRPTLKKAGALAPRVTHEVEIPTTSSVGTLPAPTRTKKRAKGAATKDDPVRRIALAVAEAGLDKKAVNVEIIDVRGKVDYADYVVVMSGTSDRQVAAIARYVQEEIESKEKTRCLGIEGLPQGQWVLIDFGDVVVHVFHEDTRGYYDLEALWVDAARVHP